MDQEQRLLLKTEDFLSTPFHLHLQAGSKMAAVVLGGIPRCGHGPGLGWASYSPRVKSEPPSNSVN